jgi:hypothetical protein
MGRGCEERKDGGLERLDVGERVLGERMGGFVMLAAQI